MSREAGSVTTRHSLRYTNILFGKLLDVTQPFWAPICIFILAYLHICIFTFAFSSIYCLQNKSVYLKRTQRQNITISNKILKECQTLLEARNANIVEFVGVCVASENIFIATAFCSKRSLQVRTFHVSEMYFTQWLLTNSVTCFHQIPISVRLHMFQPSNLLVI